MTQDKKYPCSGCGKLRTKDEGGTTFTVCDECWDKDKPKGLVEGIEKVIPEVYCAVLPLTLVRVYGVDKDGTHYELMQESGKKLAQDLAGSLGLDEKEILSICIRELWHPDLFDGLKIEPTDMNARQALKAVADIITKALSQAKEIIVMKED